LDRKRLWDSLGPGSTDISFTRKEKCNGMKKIYVGNLPFSTNEEEVTALFAQHGTVESVNLITDRYTGRLRGFGFVEMSDGGDEAITALDGTELGGRPLKVNQARERTDRPKRRDW
jgi:RNA recognition motif-containing protein